jgi:hypothetical protein
MRMLARRHVAHDVLATGTDGCCRFQGDRLVERKLFWYRTKALIRISLAEIFLVKLRKIFQHFYIQYGVQGNCYSLPMLQVRTLYPL